MIVDCISDLHGFFPDLEGGDLLIVTGDLTATDKEEQYWDFAEWLTDQDYKKIVFIAGNHDTFVELNINRFLSASGEVEFLCDSGTEFEDLKIWGSPWTHTFPGMNPHCMAFTRPPRQLKDRWAMIPEDTDILVTHGPRNGMLDRNKKGLLCGCPDLGARISEIGTKKRGTGKGIKLHVFGHIHEAYGIMDSREACKEINTRMGKDPELDCVTVHVNASLMNGDYEFVNKPIRVIL